MVKLLKKLKPFWVSITIITLLVFFQAIAELYLPNIMSDIVDIGIVNGDTDYIVKRGLIMLAVAAGAGIFTITASYLSSKVAVGFGKNLRGMVFKRVESYSLHEFNKIGTASLITRTTNDINQMQNVVVIMLRLMIYAPLMFIGGIIMSIQKDAKLAMILVVVLPVLLLIIFFVVRKGMPLFKSLQKKLDKVNLVFREGLTGIRVIRAFNRTSHESKRFDAANKDLTQTGITVNRIMAVLMPIMFLIINLATIAVVWFGGHRIDAGAMQVGDLMAFIQYIMRIMFSLMMLSMMFIFIPRASASAERINEVLDMHPEITDPENATVSGTKKGYIEFKNVSFIYPGAEEAALKNISFSASPGETTAIIGGTGSGKTTLVSMILRFYEAAEGQVLVDDIPVTDMTQEYLRHKIGYIPQKAVLFTGSVSENIRYGRNDATEEEIIAAAITAQASEFIDEREGGYDSIISQGGLNISGGQKQRLSIARALVRKPEVYIFDDSFSALDFKTDAKLRKALKSETKDSTVLIVAQRVSTIMNADRIIVLDNGSINGIGTHKELLKSCDVYREIVSSQLSEEELA
ncbi:MAG: ABC transporter ATP-binding protein [Clostridiales bacterium]|nr:ABC transporter ATP-binding protein [Clostridiales bacterium]